MQFDSISNLKEPVGNEARAPTVSTIKLRHISYQNQLASLIIQKLYRGHKVRLRLWQFNGILTVSRAVKIQRVWRGFQGRKKAALAYSKVVLHAAHVIHSLYFTWRHKRKRLVAHLKFMHNTVIKFQSQFRRRKATELVRVVRFLFHMRVAIKLQSIIRMFLAKCLVRRRRQRLKDICSHLLRYCRSHIFDNDGDSHSNQHQHQQLIDGLEPAIVVDDPSISSLDLFLCNLVGVGKFEAALELASKMSANNRNNSNSSSSRFNSDICSFAVYISLMSLWTRKGKIRAVREDYLEEALALTLQYHLMRPSCQDRKIEPQSEVITAFGVCELKWFDLTDTYLVRDKALSLPHSSEGFVPTRLGDSYDDVIVLIRQSTPTPLRWSKEQLLAYSNCRGSQGTNNLINEYNDEWDAVVQAYYHCAQPHCHGTSISSYDALLLFSDCIGYHAHNKQLLFGDVSVEDIVDPFLHLGGPHKRKHKTHNRVHVMVNRKAEQLRLSQKTDHQFNSQCDLSKYTVIERTSLLCQDVAYRVNEKLSVLMSVDETRKRFLMLSKRKNKQRMVYLLRKAQELLSPGSPSLEEISLRLEVFTNLYKDEDECDVLCCLKDRRFIFPNQSDTAKLIQSQARVYEGHVASPQSTKPDKIVTIMDPSEANTATPPPKLTYAQKQKLAKEEFQRQQNEMLVSCVHIIHTGNMILIKGFTTLDRIIAQFLPPPEYVEEKPKLPKSRTSVTLTANDIPTVDPVLQHIMDRAAMTKVAIRPLLLFHTEIEQLARENELYEEQVSAVDMEVSNVAAADAVYVHVKVIDYFKIAKYLLENVQIEPATSFMIFPEVRMLIEELMTHREKSRDCDTALSQLLTHIVKFKLSELENRRTLRNDGRLADYVTRILQKLFRGYSGRAKYKKIKQRKLAKDERLRLLAISQENQRKFDNYRASMAKQIQRIIRGKVWRAKLRVMRRCSLIIQCAFRVFRAKNLVNQERLRKSAGPQVIEMYKNGRGVVVGKAKFTLQVYRCGSNYKFEGVDLLEGCIYEGHCHQAEVREILKDFNKTIKGTTVADDLARINIWQHQRVCDKLVENLSFATMMTNVTTNMGVGKTDTKLCLVVNKQSKAGVPSIQTTKEKAVGHFYRDYNKLLVKHPQVLLNSKSVKQIKKSK